MAEARYYEFEGDQVVEVDGYAYRWDGPTPLEVGELVMMPFGWSSSPREGEVTALGTTYDGELSAIIRRMEPTSPELTTEGDITVVVENEVGEQVGRFRFGRTTVEWRRGQTKPGAGDRISLRELVDFLECRQADVTPTASS